MEGVESQVTLTVGCGFVVLLLLVSWRSRGHRPASSISSSKAFRQTMKSFMFNTKLKDFSDGDGYRVGLLAVGLTSVLD